MTRSVADREVAAARRGRVLELIEDAITRDGYPPTISDLARECDVSALTIRRDLASLVKDHKIEKDPGVTRGIRLA